jgi:hypothetical protein
MDKRDLTPRQQKPVNRKFISQRMAGLSEETLTQGWSGVSSSITPSMCPVMATSAELMGHIPFAEDCSE